MTNASHNTFNNLSIERNVASDLKTDVSIVWQITILYAVIQIILVVSIM